VEPSSCPPDIDKRQYQKPIRVGVWGIHTKAKAIFLQKTKLLHPNPLPKYNLFGIGI
jgi:hypothetical protein